MKQNKSTYKACILGTPSVHLIESFYLIEVEDKGLMMQDITCIKRKERSTL